MGAAGSREFGSALCVVQADRGQQVAPRKPADRNGAHVVPVLTLPTLPRLKPGEPLDPDQRRELVALQKEIQAKLMQQRVLVDSMRQLPQFRQGGAAFPNGM